MRILPLPLPGAVLGSGAQGGAGGAAPGWIADGGGEIADDQDGLVAQFLELPELLKDHSVSEMNVGGGWIEPELGAEGPTFPQFVS